MGLSDSQTAEPTTITTFTGFWVILIRKRVWALLAWVASVSVWFQSKERPRNRILGFGRARDEMSTKLSFLVLCSLLKRTETLATQARALSTLVWNQLWYLMELQECINVVSFQFQMNKIGRSICEFEMVFKKSSYWLSNVNNDDVISVFVKGLKKGVEKDYFFV